LWGGEDFYVISDFKVADSHFHDLAAGEVGEDDGVLDDEGNATPHVRLLHVNVEGEEIKGRALCPNLRDFWVRVVKWVRS